MAQMRSADRARQCLIFGVDRTYRGHHETDAFVLELLPAFVRASGFAIAYGIGASLFGGATQLIVTYLIGATGDPNSPAWYVTATTLVSIVAILALLKAEIGFVDNHDVMPKTSMWRTQAASRCGRCRSKAPGPVVTQDGRCQPANNRRRAGRARASRAVRATLRGQQQVATCWRPERALASAGGGNFAEHLSATYGAGMALIRATCVRPRKSMRRLIGTFRCSFLNSRT